MAHANDLVYWDSNNARALVNARGMEYQNHWGAHDPDVELPSEQLNAFFGTRAEYWTPSAKVHTPQGQLQQLQGRLQQPSGAQSQRATDGQAGKGLPGASASQRGSAVGNLRAQRARWNLLQTPSFKKSIATDGRPHASLDDFEWQVRSCALTIWF